MTRREQSSIEAFWAILVRLKRERRRGWTQKLGLNDVESVADHSYAVAMLSLYEGLRRGGYDLERLLRLALIHDLEEAITGDFTPVDKKRLGRSKIEREREAAKSRILRTIPLRARSEWLGVWRDLSQRKTREAKLVKELDLLEMAFQARDYGRVTNRTAIREFYRSAIEGMTDLRLRGIVERISERSQRRVRRLP